MASKSHSVPTHDNPEQKAKNDNVAPQDPNEKKKSVLYNLPSGEGKEIGKTKATSKYSFISSERFILWYSLRFLTAQDLAMVSCTCKEMRILCEKVSRKRCLEQSFNQQYSWTKLLRACEMVGSSRIKGPRVPVPVLCSTRVVLVEGAGVAGVNGEYINSTMGVNGRVFTRRVDGNVYILRKLYSGNQLFWYLSKNTTQLYWANVPFMEASMEEGYPPRRQWGAFVEAHRPAPETRIL
mmetsp:Transcript_31162/g.43352  ORF Transcript_31162/g.43352 Transcript_31162/m.43352 type:complete len:238 (-) Transcript_31162:175-888(-)|eukprot:CAMPEP_0185253184 /NCGR_PEP_ID=MMETSP1359-20130426/2043_1 /TAXON_ID=552665 /ORGANISM="Bigelowiella longifila, Strain CCMP242" /LENGTH=237 /DNA_ID=CAMNT_0027835523 /DNA_START=227 /DNA_END=940 /DNA_ORIENTATION=-